MRKTLIALLSICLAALVYGDGFVRVGTKIFTPGGGSSLAVVSPWSPADWATPMLAWFDAADTATIAGDFLSGELGILDVSGTNPGTGLPWKAGDQYRLAFVTSNMTTTASSDINTYNAFVNNAASNSTIAGLGNVTWKAIVSTATTDARDNTGTPLTETGVPIFQMNGTELVFTNNAHMWVTSGDPAPDNKIDMDEHGNDRPFNDMAVFSGFGGTWTGTRNDGTAESPMGNGGAVNFGIFKAEAKFWIDRGSNSSTGQCPIYALSEVLTVQAGIGAVSQWDDKSGNDNDAIQATGSRQPDYNPAEGGYIDFDGNSDVLSVTNDPFKLTNNFAVIVAGRWDTSQTWGNMMVSWDSESGANVDGWSLRQRASDTNDFIFTTRGKGGDNSSSPTDNFSDFIGVGYISGNTKMVRHTGSTTYSNSSVTGSIGTNGFNRSALGAYYGADDWTSPGSYLDGKLKEVIVVENATLTDVELLEGYMAWKWGLSGSLPSGHPYKTYRPGYEPPAP